MLGGKAGVLAVAEGLERWARRVPIVIDPVMVSTSGAALPSTRRRRRSVTRVLPLAALVTPNLLEAAALLGVRPAADGDEAKDRPRGCLRSAPARS